MSQGGLMLGYAGFILEDHEKLPSGRIPGKELFANQANLRYKNKISSVFMTIILGYNE